MNDEAAINAYIDAAMRQIKSDRDQNSGEYWFVIDELDLTTPGTTREQARERMRRRVEEKIAEHRKKGIPLPPIDGRTIP